MAYKEEDHKYIPLATVSPGERDVEEVAFDRMTSEPAWSGRGRNRLYKLFPRQKAVLSILFPLVCIISLLLLHRHFSIPVVFDDAPEVIAHEPLQEVSNPYFWKGDVWQHNDAVSARLEKCEALGLLRETRNPLEELSTEAEAHRQSLGCGTNETTVIILTSIYHAEAFGGDSTAGEVIWAQSLISTLNAYGYSYMFSSLGWWNQDMRKTVEYWEKHRKQIRMIISDPEQVDVCFNHEDQNCLKRKGNPDGVEPWRIMTFWYWDDVKHPLGANFTISPAPNNNHFLGYSIEPTCAALPKADASTRGQPPQAFLLAKQSHYLDSAPEFAWSIPALSQLQSKQRVVVAGGMVDDDSRVTKKIKAAGLRNYGKLGKIDFYEQLAKSFVLLGVGRPRISPSPWDALCMGVPFINPVLKWDEKNPDDRSKWEYQHWRMKDLHPPYVYTVKAHDYEGLEHAVKSARNHPIASYVPHHMKFDVVCKRMAAMLNADWRSVAAGVIEDRKKAGNENVSLHRLGSVLFEAC